MYMEKPVKNNYDEWSDLELSKELSDLDRDIQYWQRILISARKRVNSLMEYREDVIEVMKQRGSGKR
jgi:hypothetical protein